MGVINRDSAEFDSYRLEREFASYYGTLDERDSVFNPGKIFIPETELDIIDIVKLAKDNDAYIVVKSGGHHYIGASSCNDINCYQVDMKYFNKTEFIRNSAADDDNSITSINVGVGQKLGILYTILKDHNVAILGGNCEDVGVGGHYQSSSIGGYTRSLGLGMDYIKSITLINSNGIKETVYRNEFENNLFWAILGSSPGSWGIITEYEFEPIFDSDYPHSYGYLVAYHYDIDTFKYMLSEYMNVLSNDLLKDNEDIGAIYLSAFPGLILYDSDSAYSYISNSISIGVTWSGKNSGSIFNKIENIDRNTTYYDEILSGFDAIPGAIYVEDPAGIVNQSMPISMQYYVRKGTNVVTIPTDPYRFYLQHSSFDTNMFNQIKSDNFDLDLWINNIIDKVDSVAQVNDVDIYFQIWNFHLPSSGNQIINGEEVDSLNPMKNAVSYTGRNLVFEFDNWILFRNSDTVNEALQIREDLEGLTFANITEITAIKTMAFPDMNYNDFGDNYLESGEWRKYFLNNQGLYNKLTQIKSNIDPNNMFNGPLTIKPAQRGQNEFVSLVDFEKYHIISTSNILISFICILSLLLLIIGILYCFFASFYGKSNSSYDKVSQESDVDDV